jgi:hypothetical protein
MGQETWFDVRDLTFQPFVVNMGTDQSGCFLLSRGVRESLAGMNEIPGDWRQAVSLGLI